MNEPVIIRVVYTPEIEIELARRLRISGAFARQCYAGLIDILSAHILTGNRVAIRNFGIFQLKRVGERTINTLHGPVQVHATVCPAWKPFQSFKLRCRQANPYAQQRRCAAPRASRPVGRRKRADTRKGL